MIVPMRRVREVPSPVEPHQGPVKVRRHPRAAHFSLHATPFGLDLYRLTEANVGSAQGLQSPAHGFDSHRRLWRASG